MDKIEFKIKALKTIDNLFDKVEKLEKRKDELNNNLLINYYTISGILNNRKEDLKEKLEDIQHTSGENLAKANNAFSESLKKCSNEYAKLKDLFK